MCAEQLVEAEARVTAAQSSSAAALRQAVQDNVALESLHEITKQVAKLPFTRVTFVYCWRS